MPVSGETLDQRLRAAAGSRVDISDDVAVTLISRTREAARKPRRRIWLPLSLAAAVAVPTTASAIRAFEAQTGRFAPESSTVQTDDGPVAVTGESIPGDEVIDLNASDLEGYVACGPRGPRNGSTPIGTTMIPGCGLPLRRC